jgi:rSAM/selenodomain-associated transferase 1
MGKSPTPSVVKTRLSPPLDPQQAAQLYGTFLRDTLLAALAVQDSAVILSHPPTDDLPALLALVPPGVTTIEDPGTDLGDSMDRAFRHCFERGITSVVLIGSDLPTLPTRFIEEAFAGLEHADSDVVLGPSDDGGYYLIGLRAAQPTLFEGMVWSTDRVLSQTVERARRANLRTTLLAPLHDIDRPADLTRLIDELAADPGLTAPTTRQTLAAIWPAILPPDDGH